MTDPLTDIITAVRSKLQDELDTQLRAVGDKHAEAVATARREAELEAEQRWSALLEEARAETQRQVDAAAAAARQPVLQAAPKPVANDPLATLLKSFSEVAATESLVATLNAIAERAGDLGESSLMVLSGTQLQPWQGGNGAHATDELSRDVLVSKTTVRSETAIAVPLLLDGIVVAVLHGRSGDGATASVFDAFEALARFGSAHLANLTLVRTAQAQQWIADSTRLYGGGPAADTGQETSEDEAAAARRFARLLVSEIKLYNEGAVRVGRERGDLLQRLGEEIDRARRLYEERVPATVPDRAQHFHNELVQTLAGGDSALLG